MKRILVTLALFAAGLAAACADDVALITLQIGKDKKRPRQVALEFYEGDAPLTVENFKKLAKAGFYDGTAFHRVIKGFMIQGGDPLTKDDSKQASWGTGDPGYKIPAEFNKKSHERGVLSMARSQDPNSAGSQFFICLEDQPGLPPNYTIFGDTVAGMDVVRNIRVGDVMQSVTVE